MGRSVLDTRTLSHFRIVVLGPFGIERDGLRIDTGHWQKRVQTLFKLLAIVPERQRLREDLIEVLWPETAPDTGAGNLRMLVHRLRLVLGGEPSAVLSERDWIALNPTYSWELDLDRFEDLVRHTNGDIAQLTAAASLYRGEPLIEDRYEDWAAPVRARGQRAWRELCLQLASHHQARGAYDEAVRWLDRVLAIDGLDEEAVRELLALLANAGRTADALRHFQTFERRLMEELGVSPAIETLTLVDKLRKQLDDPGSSQPPADTPLPPGGFLGATPEGPLVDREEELDRILFAVDAVEGGIGHLILLAGEAGIGKTRLAQEAALRLRDRGFLVMTGRCDLHLQTVPYFPLLDILAKAYAAAPPLVRLEGQRRWPQLVWLLPDQIVGEEEPQLTDDQDEQYRLVRAFTGFVTLLAQQRPLAVLLDDLQWADEGTLALLLHLSQETRRGRVLLLGTYCDIDVSRDHPLAIAVRSLARQGLLERITLRRLGPDDTAALVKTTLSDADGSDEFTDFIYRRTKGNPFYIQKVVRALGGNYRLIRQVGSGGMGRVFAACDTRSGKIVAAKIMFARTETDPKALLRFQQEGAVLARLSHPNIVRVHDTIIEEHTSCIIMELLEGQTLGDLMRAGPIPLKRVKHLAEQVARALACAHDHGVVHRDIKPDNIMVLDGDQVKVTDFGIARLVRPDRPLSTMTSTGMTPGTPLYMAPEQVEGRKVDGRADIYSLGAMLFHIVTGHPPFEGNDPLSIAFRQVHEAPTLPRMINPSVPEDWEGMILKALAKDPAERFQTATAIERALTSLAVNERAHALSLPPDSDRTGHRLLGTSERDVQSRRPSRRVFSGAGGRFVRTVVLGSAALLLGIGAYLELSHVVTLPRIDMQNGSTPTPIVPQASLGHDLGQFSGPSGLALDGQGNIYVADRGNDRMQELSGNGTPIKQWGTPGTGQSNLNAPSSVAIGPTSGDIYIADQGNSRIIVTTSDGKIAHIFPYLASSIAINSHGILYATDFLHRLIREISPTGTVVRSLQIGEISPGKYKFPITIAVGGRGNLFIPNRVDNRIVKLSPEGKIVFQFGQYGSLAGQFDAPTGVALDKHGDIYVADAHNDRIQEFSPTGRFINQWGGSGSGLGQFHEPSSVAIDTNGNIFVTDYSNNRVQKLSPAGQTPWFTQGAHPQIP